MSKLSQPQKVLQFLKSQPLRKFTSREIAEAIIKLFPEDYATKRQNPRFSTDEDFINQIVAEISGKKHRLIRQSKHIHIQNKPRLFWYDENSWYEHTEYHVDDEQDSISNTDDHEILILPKIESKNLSEHDLYPLLIEFLKSELGLYCLRIDEKRSINSRGQNGNQWLHPDIVAMQPLDKHWHEYVKTCVKHGSSQNVRLWSFELKKELNRSNVRSGFFQAVSNSSWANEGYLVATSILNDDVEEELRMLSALHGIGVIILIPENPTESEILLPARRKQEADWQTINRILTENSDFKHFIDLVANYFQSGRIYTENWNK